MKEYVHNLRLLPGVVVVMVDDGEPIGSGWKRKERKEECAGMRRRKGRRIGRGREELWRVAWAGAGSGVGYGQGLGM